MAATGPCRAGKGSVGPEEVQAGLGQAGSVAGRHSCTTQGFHPKLSRLSPPTPPPGSANEPLGAGVPSAQRLVWAAKQALGNAALGALFA